MLSLEIRREIFKRLKESIPDPTTELEYVNPYTLLVAVVLSAQATDKGVNKATRELFKIVKTPEQMLDLGLEGLKHYVKTIGLYNSKAQNIIKLSALLKEKHASVVPQTRDELEALPGVGRKTANVILNTLYGMDVIAVDTHVFRLANRLKLAQAKTPLDCEKQLMTSIPQEYFKDAHHLLILHGRYVCKAQKPLCDTCVLKDLCAYYKGD